MLTKLVKKSILLRPISRGFSSLSNPIDSTVAKRDRLQFSKKRLTDFGELPPGEIPDVLQYDCPFEVSKLENGVRVGVEAWRSKLATILVSVKSGSRNETLQTSGASQFIKSLSQRGTTSRTRSQFESELDSLGGNLSIDVTRETTTFSLTVQPKDLAAAVALLGDIVQNPLFNKEQVEAERESLVNNAKDNREQMSTTLEAAHYTSFRDHFIGQPVKGIRENLQVLQQEKIKQFHEENFAGDRVVVVGTGNLDGQQFKGLVGEHFGKMKPKGGEVKNAEKPYFTPTMMYMRDDEMANVNFAVFFQAPSFNDPEYFALKLLQKVLGEYQANKYTGAHLNSAERQYSTMHGFLGGYPDITLHKCFYVPYSDTAMFGSYLFGNEVFGSQMLHISQSVLTEYSAYMHQAELFRARNSYYCSLLLGETSTQEIATKFANQLQYFGRRVPRSEVAKRLSYIDTNNLSRVITKHFWDSDISITAWGPLHNIMAGSHYNRPIRRSTLGSYGSTQLYVF